MKDNNFLTSACRFCRHYQPQGRRGGSCQILGVPVESSWEACVLASPAFDTTLENIEKSLEDILHLENSLLETSLTLNSFSEPPSRITNKYKQKTKTIVKKHTRTQ